MTRLVSTCSDPPWLHLWSPSYYFYPLNPLNYRWCLFKPFKPFKPQYTFRIHEAVWDISIVERSPFLLCVDCQDLIRATDSPSTTKVSPPPPLFTTNRTFLHFIRHLHPHWPAKLMVAQFGFFVSFFTLSLRFIQPGLENPHKLLPWRSL